MGAELPKHLRAAALLVADQHDRPVQADGEHVLVARQGGIGAVVVDVGAEAAEPGGDGFAGFGMRPDLPRQGEQSESRLEIHRVRRQVFRQRCALRLVLVRPGCALDVEPVRPALQHHRQVGRRVPAERAGLRGTVGIVGQRAGVAAGGVVRAADERAVPPELQAEPPVPAGWTGARIPALFAGREEMRAQRLVERVEDVLDPKLAGLRDRAGEIAPEIGQHLSPVDPPGGNRVQLVFERGREVVFDVAAEEVLEEGRDDAPAIFRYEAPFLQPHVVAVLKHGEDRGVGRRAADAELFQALDEARL